jgi:hypothetical protein
MTKNVLQICLLSLFGCAQPKGSVSIDVCPEEDCNEEEGIEDSGNINEDSGVEEQEPTSEPEEISEEESDADGDGYSEEEGDCDDGDPEISPSGTDDDVDGVDQDCDEVDGIDADGDGVASIESGGTDCDDTRANVSPNVSEACDDLDNDCDGVLNNDRDCLVYAHSSTTLYEVDPFLMTISQIASVPSLYDFDTDMSGTLYGISPPSSVYMFDDASLTWNQIATLSHNNGTLNGFCIDSSNNVYATVGNGIYSIDTSSGYVSLIGNIGGGFESSGDCVVDKVDGIYMTSPASGGDDLVRIDSNTGVGTLVGNTGVPGIYGLTSAWGYMFGFTGNGSLIRIDKTNGAATLLHAFPNIVFYGSASSAMR